MNIIEEVHWHRDRRSDAQASSLRSLIPGQGERRPVWIAPSALQQGTTQRLLWVPPYSEHNGWDAQPSEIAFSRIITARLAPTERAGDDGKVECTASILGGIGLLEACQHTVGDGSCDSALLANLQSVEFWDQVRRPATASVADIIFFDLVAGEAQMVLLLTGSAPAYSVRYMQLRVDGHSCAALGCWPLEERIRKVFATQLQRAAVLTDSASPYLTLDAR